MPSGKPPSPPHGPPKSEPNGRREVDPCEPIQNSLHDAGKSARTGPSESEGSHEHTLIECEKRILEIGELEQGVLDLQQSTRSPEQRRIPRTSESHLRSSGVEEGQEDRHGVSNENLEIGNPGTRQSPPSSQPVSPSALPLHLIPLLPQQSPSSKRQRRSIGLPSNQADKVTDDFSGHEGLPNNATGGTSPSLRLHPRNFSAEPAGISRTLAFAMDQMNVTHSSEYLPLRGAEFEELVATREGEVYCEVDAADRPKTVRFEESTCQPADLAERLWTNAIQAVAATTRTHEGSEHIVERARQSGEQGEEPTWGQDASVGGKNMEGGEREMLPEGDVQSFLREIGAVTLGKVEEGQSMDATWRMDAEAWCATKGGSWTVDLDSGSEAEQETLASQPVKPAQLQEYARLKEREAELKHTEAECRILEEKLEAREKDLRSRLGTVRQRLEAVRQRRASVNRQEEILRQKMEAVTKEAQGPANVLGTAGTDAPPESS